VVFKANNNAKSNENRADLIWIIANKIVELYKSHENGKVIGSFMVIKRFDYILFPTHCAVFELYERYKNFEVKDSFLFNATKMVENLDGYKFNNTSPFTFEVLLSVPEYLEKNLRSYINGFSQNVQDFIAYFEFDKEIT
jgi:type I restriction enzyme M protein